MQTSNATYQVFPPFEEAAHQLLGQFGWTLLSVGELAEKAAALWEQSGRKQGPSYACWQAFAAELYERVAGRDTIERELAYQEIWLYLFTVATKKCQSGRQAEELAQQALVTTWEKLEQCRSPHQFIGWATKILINEIRQDYRQQTRPASRDGSGRDYAAGGGREMREIPIHDSAYEDEQYRPEVEQPLSPGDSYALHEAAQQLRQALRSLLPSAQQVRVIEALFLEEHSPAQVAAELGCKTQYVYALKFRALQRLKGAPKIISALSDLAEAFPIPQSGVER